MESNFITISSSTIDGCDNEVLVNVSHITSVQKAANGVVVKLMNGSYYLDVSRGFNDYKKMLESK